VGHKLTRDFGGLSAFVYSFYDIVPGAFQIKFHHSGEGGLIVDDEHTFGIFFRA
jgi:hypothetical protein